MGLYEVALTLVGVGTFGAIVLPRLLSDRPLSFPVLYVLFGAVAFSLPLGLPNPDPIEHRYIAERLTELVVVVALMGAGLKIDRPFDVGEWNVTWRLLAVTMPLTIAAVAGLGLAVGLTVPVAVLLGAVVAPTDPVIASDVQVGPPSTEREYDPGEAEVPFALTSEAGFNDGLAFPFTYAAILLVTVGLDASAWVGRWATFYVGYKILAGAVVGLAVGWTVAHVTFARPATTVLAEAMTGAEALATTLVAYGFAELAAGYGFIAVFVAALALRHYERGHEYHDELHDVTEMAERLLMAAVLVLFGGALVGGLLDPLTPAAAAVSVLTVLVVRPLAGLAGLVGFDAPLAERAVVAFFGIRGVGSFFYLAYALGSGPFADADLAWAIVGGIVLTSVVVHGVTASPAMKRIENRE